MLTRFEWFNNFKDAMRRNVQLRRSTKEREIFINKQGQFGLYIKERKS